MSDSILDVGLLAMVFSATSGVFSAPSFDNFLTLATGWVLCRARRTTTGLIVAAGAVGGKHFGSYHRFFSQAVWQVEQLWLGLLWVLIEELRPEGEVVLVGDDTVQAKSGKKISGAANWRNACGSTRQQYRFLWGHNWVILALAVAVWGKTYSLPICLRLYRKRADCERLGRPYRTRSQLLLEMVQATSQALSGRDLVLLTDGHYATKHLLGGLPKSVTAISRLRKDAALWRTAPAQADGAIGRPRKRGRRLPRPEQIAGDGRRPWKETAHARQLKTLVALWYRVRGTQPVRVVIVEQKNPREPYAYLLCTDPEWSADRIVSTYAARWTIEITIRDAKQFAGFGDAQCRKGLAVERQAAFTLGMMSLVMGWYLGEGHRTGPLLKRPWYRGKTHPSFQDMLAHARRCSWRQIVFARSGAEPDIAENATRLLRYLEAAA